MVKYIDGDFGPEHFSKDFGFSNSAYEDRASRNRRGRQRDGVADNSTAVGEPDDGTYVGRSRGGRLHRAAGGSAMGGAPQNMIPGNRLPNDPSNPGNEMLGGATVTMPAANMAQAANKMYALGQSQGARQAIATMGARMPPGATQSLVANPPVHQPGIPGLKGGGRAPAPPVAGQHPKGVLVIIAGHPPGTPAPMPAAGRARGRVHRADGGAADRDDAPQNVTPGLARGGRIHRAGGGEAGPGPDLSRVTNAPVGGALARWWRGDDTPMGPPAPRVNTAPGINQPFGQGMGSKAYWNGDDDQPANPPGPQYGPPAQDNTEWEGAPPTPAPAARSMGEGALTGSGPKPAPRPINKPAKTVSRPASQPPKASDADLLMDYWNNNPNPTPDGARSYLAAHQNGYAHGGRLTAKERHALPANDFALPGGRYPVNDANHARAALSRVAANGTPTEQDRVRAAVHRKYPSIGKR